MSSNRLYRFGFLAIPVGTLVEVPAVLETWNLIRVDGWKLFIHPEAPVTSVEDSAARRVVAVGDVFVAHGATVLDDHLLSIARGKELRRTTSAVDSLYSSSSRAGSR